MLQSRAKEWDAPQECLQKDPTLTPQETGWDDGTSVSAAGGIKDPRPGYDLLPRVGLKSNGM